MKKKTIAGIIAATMVLSLVGCSGSASNSTTDESVENSASEETLEEGPVEADIDDDSDSDVSDSEYVVDNSDLQDDQFRYDGKVFSVMGDVTISFIVTDGLVAFISYTNNANHDQFSWS